MPQNLFVACRTAAGLVAKRVRLDQAVQQQVEGIFNQQEADFRDGITSEVAFATDKEISSFQREDYIPTLLEAAKIIRRSGNAANHP